MSGFYSSGVAMQMPPEDTNDYLGFDASGRPWILRWAVPPGDKVWTAIGFDHRNYPCSRTLTGEWEKLILSWTDLGEVRPV